MYEFTFDKSRHNCVISKWENNYENEHWSRSFELKNHNIQWKSRKEPVHNCEPKLWLSVTEAEMATVYVSIMC